MSHHRESGDDKAMAEQAPVDDPIGRLLRLAGPRPEVPAERTARVEAAAREAWQARVSSFRRRRVMTRLAVALPLAATLALALGVLRFLPREHSPVASPSRQQVGTVARVEGGGAVLLPAPGGTSIQVPLSTGMAIHGGDVLSTGEGTRLAVLLETGHSLRLNEDTRVALGTSGELALDLGMVYVDSGEDLPGPGGMAVRTPLGLVREVGTQFEVALDRVSVRVRVRRGAVAVEAGDNTWEAPAGLELTVDREGRDRQRRISIHGPEWEWVQAVAPSFPLEGQTLSAFLSWVDRETGRSPRISDPELVEKARTIILHGSVEGLTPTQAVEAVLPTCGLVHRWEEDALVVAPAPGEVAPTS